MSFRRLLSLAVFLAMLLCLVFPVSVSGNDEDPPDGAGGSGLTGNMPQKVETAVSPLEGIPDPVQDIRLITADRYFKYTGSDGSTNRQFFAIFNTDITGICSKIVISTSEESGGLTCSYSPINTSINGVVTIPDSWIQLLLNEPVDEHTIYVSLWGVVDGTETKLYQSGAVTVRFVDDDSADCDEKYIDINKLNVYLNGINVPYLESLSGNNLELQVIDGSGNILAKTIDGISQVSCNVQYGISDYRYDEIFGKTSHGLKRSCQSLSGMIYRCREWQPGSYGIRIKANGSVVAEYDNVVEIVDGTVIYDMGPALFSGLPPIREGDRVAYVELDVMNVDKDDLTIRITNTSGEAIGVSGRSKYAGINQIIYEVNLHGSYTFSAGETYYLEAASDGPVYYSHRNRSIGVFDQFVIFGFDRDEGNLAKFVIRTVNAPQEEATFRLYKDEGGGETLLGSKTLPLTEKIDITFEDGSGSILRLDTGDYRLSIALGYDEPDFFFRVVPEYSVRPVTEEFTHVPCFHTTDTTIPFSMLVSTDAYNITDTTEIGVLLKDSAGSVIGRVADDGLTVTDAELSYPADTGYVTVDAKEIAGEITVNDDVILSEGLYSISVAIGGSDEVTNRISCIRSDKVYAYFGYPDFYIGSSVTTLKTNIYMLKKDEPYDTSKFRYVVTDLLGNPVSIGEPTVTRTVYDAGYQEKYTIESAVAGHIPAAFYMVRIQYDNKDIYNIFNPSSMLYTGDYSLVKLPAARQLGGWYYNDSGLYGVSIDGYLTDSDVVKAMIYDPDRPEDFDPVKTVMLSRDDRAYNLFVFTDSDVAGLQSGKEYLVAILLNDVFLLAEEAPVAVIESSGGGDDPGSGSDQGGSGDSGGSQGGSGDTGGSGSGTSNVPSTETGPSKEDSVTNPEVTTDNTGKASVKKELLEIAEDLTIKAGDGAEDGKPPVELVFDMGAVETLKELDADLEISVTEADVSKLPVEAREKIGDRPVYEFKVSAGGSDVTDFGGGFVTIRIPYTLSEGEDPNAIVVYYIGANGELNVITGGVYDPDTGTIVFRTNHFSMYGVGYNKIEFTDVPAWAEEYVTFLAARGIITGVGGGKYGAGDQIKRADFVTMLARTAGVDTSKYSAVFDDVDPGAKYAGAVGWAAENGITTGTGKNVFSPNAGIKRQDMAVMIKRFVDSVGYELPSVNDWLRFADQDEISSYAVDAVAALQQAGIIDGKTGPGGTGKVYAPKDVATRAEIAKILTLLIKGIR